jgi:hypothetical protein
MVGMRCISMAVARRDCPETGGFGPGNRRLQLIRRMVEKLSKIG